MNKILLSLALVAVASTTYAKTNSPLNKQQLQTMNFFKNKGISILGTSNVKGTDITLVSFLAKTPQGDQKMSAFVPKGKKYVIVGGGYNDQDGEQLIVPINMSVLKKDAAFVVGSGKQELFIFTDPECPYCMKMDKEVLSKLPKDKYSAYVYFYPLPFHRYAESAAYYIMSQKSNSDKEALLSLVSEGFKPDVIEQMKDYDVSLYRLEQQRAGVELSEIMNKKNATPDDYAKADMLQKQISDAEANIVKKIGVPLMGRLKKQMEVASSLGVGGTPTVFDNKGGQVNWMTLLPPKK